MGENFRNNVLKLVELEKEEEKYKNIVNNIKNEKDIVSNSIIKYLTHNNLTDKDIVLGDSKIKYAKNKTIETITKKRIEERLKLFLKNENLAIQATEFIYADREHNYKEILKITNKIDIKK